jgi:hypothetical protein
LWREINCSDKPEENQGPIGALLQSCSVLLCLTLEAGFSSVRRIPMDNPFNSLYELTP